MLQQAALLLLAAAACFTTPATAAPGGIVTVAYTVVHRHHQLRLTRMFTPCLAITLLTVAMLASPAAATKGVVTLDDLTFGE